MGYILHNFLAGQALTAEALNEMDGQIKANTDAAETYTPQMVDDSIADLSLRTDGEWLILSHGNVEIAEVAIASVADIIPCEALELTSPDTQNIFAGDTFAITCDKSPVDTNQILRFRSAALSVASVDSAGLVTAKDIGTAIIYAMCGRFSVSTTVNVSKIIKPTWRIGNWLALANTTTEDEGLAMSTDKNNRLIVAPYEGDIPIYVKAGQSIKVQPNSNYALQLFWVITPTNESLTYGKTWSDGDVITGATFVNDIGDGMMPFGASHTYQATADCYIAFMVVKTNAESFEEQEAEQFNDTGAVTITVSPA